MQKVTGAPCNFLLLYNRYDELVANTCYTPGK